VNAIKWDPQGKFLASCSDDMTLKVSTYLLHVKPTFSHQLHGTVLTYGSLLIGFFLRSACSTVLLVTLWLWGMLFCSELDTSFFSVDL
jgi:hypothetical protein